jgi:hypothetical protein
MTRIAIYIVIYVSSVVVLTPNQKVLGFATNAFSERYADPVFYMLISIILELINFV